MILTKAEFILEAAGGESVNYNMGSLTQGALMEKIDPVYAEFLHRSRLNPYSQYLLCQNGTVKWIVTTLTEEAEQEIIAKLLNPEFSSVVLTQKNLTLGIRERLVARTNSEELFEKTFFARCPRVVSIRFLTPAAFKTNERYQNYPTLRHIFQSLINRYNMVNGDNELPVESTLQSILDNAFAAGYNLHSTTFGVEGVRIPSFLGRLTLKLNGPQQLVNLIHMLLSFGAYSGIGIKTAMGMGAIQIIEREGEAICRRNHTR